MTCQQSSGAATTHSLVAGAIGLTDDARVALHWMATDGETPVIGKWTGTALIVWDPNEVDYLWQVLRYNFTDTNELVTDDEWVTLSPRRNVAGESL